MLARKCLSGKVGVIRIIMLREVTISLPWAVLSAVFTTAEGIAIQAGLSARVHMAAYALAFGVMYLSSCSSLHASRMWRCVTCEKENTIASTALWRSADPSQGLFYLKGTCAQRMIAAGALQAILCLLFISET
ncbi:hypothetical protein Q4I28_002614 [Leishmania naiffi]|uniref:Uncharacterized protein n=1 Tax=Leishmania naiffi TaxID=5678 RepID=A0AAW3C0S2_9TRYP